MKSEKVIELGKSIPSPDLDLFAFDTGTLVVFGLALVLFVASMTVLGDSAPLALLVCIVLVVVNFVNHTFNSFDNYYDDVRALVYKEEKWETEVVYPYIESLPIKKQELSYVKISSDSSGDYIYRTDSSDKDTETVNLLVAYTNPKGDLITKTGKFKAKLILDKEAKPYMEYQELTEDLGNHVNTGLYNATIYLPKNFTFTEIK